MRQLGYILAVLAVLALGCWSEAVLTEAQKCHEAQVEQVCDVPRPPVAGILPDGQEAMTLMGSRQLRSMQLPSLKPVRLQGACVSPRISTPASLRRWCPRPVTWPAVRRAGSRMVIALRHIIR